MAAPAVLAFLDILRKNNLLEPEQDAELDTLSSRFPDPRALAREMLARGWLTAYQAGLILQGQAEKLVLGQYVIVDLLGEGGMGAVYKARHQTMGRTVALKVIRAERLKNPDSLRRFRREIKAAAQLNHPNIVRAFDADEVSGTHFLVMEYVEGADLAQVVRERGPLPVADACEYIRQAALGLQDAFGRGMVHRDIKPSNLLLATSRAKSGVAEPVPVIRDAQAAVKILDMGLARIQREEGQEDSSYSTITKDGVVMGSLDFIAPEQAMDSSAVDIRADLYSLGCTFYFLLTGQVPFPGGDALAKLAKHRWNEPRSVAELRPDVPPGVVAVLRKLMAKDPKDRFQTPGEAAQALAAGPSAMAVASPPASSPMAPVPLVPASRTPAPEETAASLPPSSPAPVQTRRRFPVLGATLAVLLAAVGGLLGVVYLYSRPTGGPFPSASGPVRPVARRVQSATLVAQAATPALGRVRQLSFSRDGQLLLSVTETKKVDTSIIWQVPTMTLRTRLQATAAAFTPDNAGLVLGKVPDIWFADLAGTYLADQPTLKLATVPPMVQSLQLVPDSKAVVASSINKGDTKQGTALLWKYGTDAEAITVQKDEGRIYALAVSPDGRRLACLGVQGRVYDLEAPEAKPIEVNATKAIRHAEFGPDGRTLLAVLDTGGPVILYTYNNDAFGQRASVPGTAATLTHDGTTLIVARDNQLITFVDADTLQEQFSFAGPPEIVTCLEMSPDGRHLAVGTELGKITLYGLTYLE